MKIKKFSEKINEMNSWDKILAISEIIRKVNTFLEKDNSFDIVVCEIFVNISEENSRDFSKQFASYKFSSGTFYLFNGNMVNKKNIRIPAHFYLKNKGEKNMKTIEKITALLGFIGVTMLSFNYVIAMMFLIIYDLFLVYINRVKGLKILSFLALYYFVIGLIGIWRNS